MSKNKVSKTTSAISFADGSLSRLRRDSGGSQKPFACLSYKKELPERYDWDSLRNKTAE